MPKLDCLVDGSLKRDELLVGMGLDPARKTILYAPTWSAHSSVVTMGEELVQRLGDAGYGLIVKLHDRSRHLEYIHSGGVDWGARLVPLLQKFGGVLGSGRNSSPYLAAADVMVLPTASEGLANVWVESLACGTPVVTSDVGGAREVIDSPAFGRLVPRDPEAIADAIRRVLADPPDPAEVRRGAERFSWEKNGAELAAHLRGLIP